MQNMLHHITDLVTQQLFNVETGLRHLGGCGTRQFDSDAMQSKIFFLLHLALQCMKSEN